MKLAAGYAYHIHSPHHVDNIVLTMNEKTTWITEWMTARIEGNITEEEARVRANVAIQDMREE